MHLESGIDRASTACGASSSWNTVRPATSCLCADKCSAIPAPRPGKHVGRMKNVPYNRQTIDTPNPIARYAHRSRHRRALAIAERSLPECGTVVDFGCGVGSFLNELKKLRPDATLLGYDPGQVGIAESFERISSMDELGTQSVDVLCAFEVLEHLSDEQIASFIAQARRVLRLAGTIIVSVPIIGGLTLPLKELNRLILFRRKPDHSLIEVLRATFFGTPAKRPINRGPTHKGFDFRETRAMLATTFSMKSEVMCPFESLPWWLNSQAFFVLGHRA